MSVTVETNTSVIKLNFYLESGGMMYTHLATIFIYVVSLVILPINGTDAEAPEIPIGHLKPFGDHRPPDVPVDETESIPDPWTFWEKYVKPGDPLILRGAAKKSPAFSLWTEDYLTQNYGDLEIRLEGKSEAWSPVPVGSEGLGRDKISSFLKRYGDKDTYVISQLPVPMYRDVMVLPCMSCGNMGGRMVEVDLWMSSGDSESILHKDAFNQMNCLFNGTKRWKLVHNKYEKFIHKTWEPSREIGGHSDIDVNEVDLLKYPNITKIRWSDYTLKAGDCIFLPKGYYHQVNSFGPMNVAVSILFSRITTFEDHDCDSSNHQPTPLSEMDVQWDWQGHGTMSMGNMDLLSIRWSYMQQAKKVGYITKEVFMEEFSLLMPEKILKKFEPSLKEAWAVIDPEDRGRLSVDDIELLDIPTLRDHALKLDLVEPSNTHEFEYYYIDADDIKELITSLLDEDGHLSKTAFIMSYTTDPDFGGTEKFALEIFEKLQSTDSETATREEVVANIDEALENWSSRTLLDATPETDFSSKSILWKDEFEDVADTEAMKDEL